MPSGKKKTRKQKSVEKRLICAEESVGNVDDISAYEKGNSDYDSLVFDETADEILHKMEMEGLIFFLSKEAKTVLVLKHLGFTTAEVIEIMGLRNLREYYGHHQSLLRQVYLFKTLRASRKN
jgi:hypothetical protein